MAVADLRDFVGDWELAVDLPGAEGIRGHVLFETMGEILIQRTTVPIAEAPDTNSVVVTEDDRSYIQHYFDSRGVARLYAMTFDGRTWTLERTEPDFSPLDFQQRYVGRFTDDRATIDGEWQTSADGQTWSRDFRLTYKRVANSLGR
jgi:hypothetical protein